MHRFFVAKDQLPIISGSDAHHIKDVLRMKAGDPLELLDGSGKIYEAKIGEIGNQKITCKITSFSVEENESKIRITLAQALPKAQKMDFIIQKCTELGVHKIIPVQTERTIVKSVKVDRWRKIAKSAAEQCGRVTIPEISFLTKFEDVIKTAKNYDLALIPWELEKEKNLKSSLVHRPSPILILVGPEGGFSQKEIEHAREAGFVTVSLGKRILRTETAAMVVLAIVMHELE